jgi:hypothetical protein
VKCTPGSDVGKASSDVRLLALLEFLLGDRTVAVESTRLSSKHVGATHSILPCRVFFRRTAEAIEVGHHMDVLKAEILQPQNQFCLRQSASDSIGPQSNVAASLRSQWRIENDVPELQTTTWT